jgi:dsRNA-specific ribonuclease
MMNSPIKSQKFTCKLDFGGIEICTGDGKNKKEARSKCAKNAICLVAPKIFDTKFPGEDANALSK